MPEPLAQLVRRLTPKRRSFQFSLTTMFLVVTVFCVWLAVQVHQVRRQREAVAAVRSSGGWVRYDFQFVQGKFDPQATSRVSGWLKPLGDDFVHQVVEVYLVYDNDGKPLGNHHESDEALRDLACFPRLKRLLLAGGKASEEGLAYVSKLSELEEIYIWDAKIPGWRYCPSVDDVPSG